MNESPLNKNEVKYCAIKNCHKPLEKGNKIEFGGKVYCKECGTQIIKQSLLG